MTPELLQQLSKLLSALSAFLATVMTSCLG